MVPGTCSVMKGKREKNVIQRYPRSGQREVRAARYYVLCLCITLPSYPGKHTKCAGSVRQFAAMLHMRRHQRKRGVANKSALLVSGETSR